MFLAGRFMILGGSTDEFLFGPWELSFLVLYMDLMVALLVVYHIGFLFKLPWLGRRLALLAMQSRLASTGSIGGGILARLCGISRTGALAAILLGSVLGCAAMFAGAELIRRYLDPTSPATIGAGIAVIVVVVVVLNWLYRRAVRATGPAA
jgi:hypothetical protein